MSGTASIVGAYRLPPTEAVIQSVFDRWGSTDRAEVLDFVRSIALVEVLVRTEGNEFDMMDVVQPNAELREGLWQAAYDEFFLTADGSRVLDVKTDVLDPRPYDLSGLSEFRVAFWLHDYDPASPIRTSFGDMECPSVEELPPRLREFAHYSPPD